MSTLSCHVTLSHRYGAKWSKKWAQEPAYRKILAELPEIIANHTTPINPDVYPNWQVKKWKGRKKERKRKKEKKEKERKKKRK